MCLQLLLSDFEVKNKEEVERPQGLTIGIPVQHRDQPLTPDEIPVESGSVLRQKNEIEMKYGSSPRHSKLSPDNSLCPSSVSSSDGARLTPTLEKYCASDILSLTEDVPEGFLDEDAEDMQECDRQRQLRVDSSELSRSPDPDLSEGHLKWPKSSSDVASQFQRSFSYRENCQQKQSKTSPFFSRSASLRSRWSSDVAKNEDSVVVSGPSIATKTCASSLAAFSSTEVCRRLLKEQNQQNECVSGGRLSNDSNDSKQVKHADVSAEVDKQVTLSNVLNTEQLRRYFEPVEASANRTVGRHTESSSSVGDKDCKYDLQHADNQNLTANVSKSVALPVVTHDQQVAPTSAFICKGSAQQSVSHSSRTRPSAEQPSLLVCLSDNDRQLSSLAGTGTDDSAQSVEGNVGDDDGISRLMGDSVQGSSHNQPVVDSSQSQSAQEPAQVDTSNDVSDSAVHSRPQSDDSGHMSGLKKRFSLNDKYAGSFIPTEQEKVSRSQSVCDKSSSSLRCTTGDSEPLEAQKVKKAYGKTHPLSTLPSEYLSRDCSRTVKDIVCDHDTELV